MQERYLSKGDILPLLNQVSKQWGIYAPVEQQGGDFSFSKFDSCIDKINLDYAHLTISPKDIFFPQLEKMFEFNEDGLRPIIPSGKKLVFGLRACDLKAIQFLDAFFAQNFQDIYYLSRAEARLSVAVGCILPQEDCFCKQLQTGPFLTSGFDLQLVDIGDVYLVEVGSKGAEGFVKQYIKFFALADKGMIEQAEDIKQKISSQFPSDNEIIKETLSVIAKKGLVKEVLTEFAERCILCGGCLYVCPTCSCFNIFDYISQQKVSRFRNWDSCMFEGYSRLAGGYNPRSEKSERFFRRYEHKLIYDYQTTGTLGCVGCGRCSRSCPVNIGMVEVIKTLGRLNED